MALEQQMTIEQFARMDLSSRTDEEQDVNTHDDSGIQCIIIDTVEATSTSRVIHVTLPFAEQIQEKILSRVHGGSKITCESVLKFFGRVWPLLRTETVRRIEQEGSDERVILKELRANLARALEVASGPEIR